MRCPNCRVENPAGNRFCSQCGTGLTARCPQCGVEVASGAMFCGQCGVRLGPALEPAPAAAAISPQAEPPAPSTYTPKHLAEKILNSRSALEGERRIVTVRGYPSGTPCRRAGRSDRPVPAWPWCTAPLGVAGASVELPGSRQSLAEPRSEGRDPPRRWASRVAPCSLPTCHAPYPGERSHRYWSVAQARSHGLPRNSGGSALTTSLSRPARASHVLRPVGLQTHPWWTDVPRASASQSPSLLPR